MPDKRIYELTEQSALASTDYLVVDKSGNSEAKKVPASVITDLNEALTSLINKITALESSLNYISYGSL